MYNNDMYYKALYRTYRPKKFSEVVGQKHIIQTLQNALKQNKIAHAYLFAGPRGTGKTSVAQIFAKAINSKTTSKKSDFIWDIIEIDAASNNGITEVRTLIENSKFSPTEGEYKIYIIDEVHMLTKSAWNALLKILEEPPSHIVFILATTEPHKVPITILSRVQRFNFKRIDNFVINQKLTEIFKKEKISFDDESLNFIAKLANGGLRDALTIADQAAAFGNNTISFEAISQVFGLISINKQIEILNLMYKNDVKKLIKNLQSLIENGADLERLTWSLIEILKDFIIYNKTADLTLINCLNQEYLSQLIINVNFAYLVIDELIKLSSDIKWTELPQQLFELTILKLSSIDNLNDTKQSTILKPEIINNYQSDKRNQATNSKNVVEESINDKLFNKELHNLNFLSPLQLETLEEENIFHTTIIEPNKIDDDRTITQKLVDQSETMILNQVLQKNLDELHNIKHQKANYKNLPNSETIDIVKLFGLDDKTDAKENNFTPEVDVQPFYTSEEIINLLLLADKRLLEETKERWNILSAYVNSGEYGLYASLLASVKIITCGEHFVLVSSNDNETINQLNKLREELTLLRLLENILGKPKWIYGLTRNQFEEIKKRWNIMKVEQTLPASVPIKSPKLQKHQSETEEFALEIFGELLEK